MNKRGVGLRLRLPILLVVSLAGLAGIGCGLEPPETDSGELQQREDVLVDGDEFADTGHIGHRRSLPDVVLRWERDSADELVSTMPLIVENHAQRQLSVSLQVEVTAPVGVSRMRSLPVMNVDAGQRAVVPIAVNWLPVQTEGEASSVGVSATWTSPGPVSTNPDEHDTEERRMVAMPRFVTWAADGTAAVRSDKDQIRFRETEFLAEHPPRLTELRTFDESTGQFTAMPEAELAGLPVSRAGSEEFASSSVEPGGTPKADAPIPPEVFPATSDDGGEQ